MSDPVSNAEVEDVLSSIRRLVSEEKRTPVASDAPSTSNRLVLTPALRVAENIRPVVQDGAQESVQDDSDDQPDALETVQFRHEPDVQPEEDALTPDAETEQSVADILILAPDAIAPTQDDHEDAQSDDDHGAHEQDSDEAVADTTPADAQFEDAQFDDQNFDNFQDNFQDDDQHSDHNADDHDDADQHDDKSDTATDENADDIAQFEDADDVIPVAEPVEPMQAMSNAASLSAKIAALETVIGRTDDQWEPDDTGDSDYSGTEAPAMSWEDTDAVDENTDTTNETDVFGSAEDFLDEDALRDLVSDIVREELQGALGERITRNVRKLVRREIHRALAAQELE
jgi:hypothetical protein